MMMFRSTVYMFVAILLVACQPDETGGNNGWIDASLDGSNDVADRDSASDGGQDASPDWRACTRPTDCVLRANSCCGVCGQPELGDMDAVNQGRTDAHFQDVCPEPGPCPDCVQEPNPYLVATCEAQVCAGYDVRDEPFTECESDSDCRVRVRECCECGGTTTPSALIAIANTGEQAYQDLVCGGAVDCPECVPSYPDNVAAVCGESGHCEVEVTP